MRLKDWSVSLARKAPASASPIASVKTSLSKVKLKDVKVESESTAPAIATKA
eukprot:CAMPEP_0198489184 /NCGR_PEP_ID=MMETSP1462-20131121/1284_1 /TAXON_ID=1333877 /ORGANISM="Brandtodinium nutriculum, Strain RCC3387" /LENGTH=51 /DNA_ID=CAMNT_0044217677 /DNA_START=92 /DNA_END=244 /DNA_ORIENTATION=+